MKKSDLTLVIGDKNLSSWSMRPWLVLKQSGLPFKEVNVPLDRPETGQQISRHSPSGKVPVLWHGKLKVWDSLAICEYIHELVPEKNLWPKEAFDRAIARSLTAEMHSGFTNLRSQLSMDLTLRIKIKHLSPSTLEDIRRITHIWEKSMDHNGGPFLIREFGIIDAFFAPVVCRFISYGLDIKNKKCRRYMEAVMDHSAVKEWVKGAQKERFRFPSF